MEELGVSASRQIELLKRELDDALERQAATSDILRVISTSPTDVQPVFNAIAQSAARLCEAEYCFVFRFDGTLLHPAAYHGVSSKGIDAVRAVYPRKPDRGTATGRAFLSGTIEQIPDVFADPDYGVLTVARVVSFRSAIGIPLMRRGQPIGSIGVSRRQVGAFPERQVELLRTFADQAVIAIENVRLFEEAQARNREVTEALEQQTATSEILRVISTSPTDLQPVFDTIALRAARLCDAQFCHVFRYDGELLHFVAHHRLEPEGVEAVRALFPTPPDRGNAAGRSILSKSVEQIPDRLVDPDYTAHATLGDESANYRSLVGVPIMRDGNPIGTIVVARAQPGLFPVRQVELLRVFADQAGIAVENVRLFEEAQARNNELKEALQQQTATAEVLKVISRSAFDLQGVLDTLVRSAVSLCEAYDAVIFLREGDTLRVKAHHGPIPVDFPGWPVSRGWVSGRAVVDRAPVHVSDLAAAADEFPDGSEMAVRMGHRTIVATPLLRGEEAIGALAIRRTEVRPFTDRQIELIQTFADQAVIAIENIRLFEAIETRTEELSRALQHQTATADVLKIISRSAFDLQGVLDTLTDSAARLCDADMAGITRRDGDFLHWVSSLGFPDEWRQLTKTMELEAGRGSLVGRALMEGAIVQVADVLSDPEYTYLDAQRVAGFRTAISVPLLREGLPIGVLFLARTIVAPFTQGQIELLQTFADQAVIAIENVRLFDEVQARSKELQEALQQQTATADVLQVISRSTFDLKTVLDTLTVSAARLCQADMSGICRSEGAGFYYASSHGFPEDWLDYNRERRLDTGRGSVVGRVLEDGRTFQLEDVLSDPKYTYREPALKAGFRTFLGVPLLREDRPIGVLVLGRKAIAPFSERQIELVKTFADQAVIAIENVRLFDEVKARTADLEEALAFQKGMADVLDVIGRSAAALQPVLNAIIETSTSLCRADMAVMRLVKDGALCHVASSQHTDPALLKHSIDNPILPNDRSSIAGRVALAGETIHVHDVTADPEYGYLAGVKGAGVRTVLGVPLLHDGKVVGVIALLRKTVAPFTERQIRLVQTLADQTVIALSNVHLFQTLEARTQQLARSLEDLRTAQDRLVQTEKLASLGQLTAGIAHEIKNPLNFVNNFSSVSKELVEELVELLGRAPLEAITRDEAGELTDLLKGNLEKVVQHGKRADSIVKNMLLHSRQGSGEHRSVDINAIVEESLNLAYHGARAEKQGFNITLEKSLDPAAGEVDIYPQEITRALLNLIGNGFYATRERAASETDTAYEPTLATVTRNLGDTIEIIIRDNGTGIPLEAREKMFNPFFTTKPAGEGTGLGLSLSHDIIVKQHAGSIEVDSELGRYTEFRIRLPRNAAIAATLEPTP